MSTISSSVPAYVRSKVRPYVDENSLLLRALNLPGSVLNVFKVTGRKPSFVAQAYGYSTWIISKIWRVASWRALKSKEISKEKGIDEWKSEMASQEDVILGDYLASNFTFSCFRKIYLHFLEHNFLGITRESLELLRDESKVLQELQDFELVKVLKSLFECQSSDAEEKLETELNASNISFTNVKNLVLKATGMVWKSLYNRIAYYIPVFGRDYPNKVDPGQENCTVDQKLENDHTNVNRSEPTSNIVPLSAGSLLLCESNLLTKVLTDSGTYALTSTHDLLRESLLLFIPMEILENTTALLKNPTSLVPSTSLSAFWELYNYVSIWGLDILEDCYNQPDIEYAVIDDDDFHFVVNVPKMKRPILFIGIR